MKTNTPSAIRVSINRVTSLAEDSTRSYTCSMYSEGTSISRLITPENAATLRNALRLAARACLISLVTLEPSLAIERAHFCHDCRWNPE